MGVPWRSMTNRALRRSLGAELQQSYVRPRPGVRSGEVPRWIPARGARLLPSPVFVICPVRSGSTLLCLILNGHSQIHAPHELHLTKIAVEPRTPTALTAMTQLELTSQELEHLLWDRILHRELERSGKSVLVEKTPNNARMWRRLATCWPEARFIFLLRHPATVLESWTEIAAGREVALPVEKVVRGMQSVARAREHLPGLTVRYEELTADPGAATASICAYLGLDFEPAMLDYGHRPTTFVRGLGDWREKIRSGTVQAGRPVPDHDLPDEVQQLCRSWGYRAGSPANGRST